jgi:hypothetical protein
MNAVITGGTLPWTGGKIQALGADSEIERALRLFHGPARDARGLHICMPQQRLDRSDIVIRLKQMSGERVAEGVGGDALGELCPPDSFTCSDFESGGGYFTRKSR